VIIINKVLLIEIDPNRSLKVRGLEATRQKWEKHWLSALTEDDFRWLKDVARCNSIRLPIGFFTLGPNFCSGTAFEGEPSHVYNNAWGIVKRLVTDCHHHGIGVLLDLHAAPGGANAQNHSGTDSGKAELWKSAHNLSLARDCIAFIIQEVTHHDLRNVIGIQLCNEPMWNAPGIQQWHDEILSITSVVDPSLPIYIGDCWNLSAALDYAMKKNKISDQEPMNPVIVDTHKYYTFTEAHRSKSPQEIIASVPGGLEPLKGLQGNVFDKKSAVAVYIGEYSCVMDTKTWNRVDASERPGLTKSFGHAQTQLLQQKAAGSAFWTLKMNWMDGGGWGFKAQVKSGAIVPPRSLTVSREEVISKVKDAEAQRPGLREVATTQHVQHWNTAAPKTKFEHWRFTAGWDIGFSDAMNFFCARVHGVVPDEGERTGGGDKIGALDLWIKKRIVEADQHRQPLGWQWEHGFRKGVDDFYAFASV
jgi:aryl-phospho-beta-D-glucosidase BglC (GH1 family)